jgi:hypothetical protein
MGKRGRATVAVFCDAAPPWLVELDPTEPASGCWSPEVSIDVIVTEHQAPAGSPAKGSG